MANSEKDEIRLAVMGNDLKYIKKAVTTLDQKVSTHYVSREEFEPVKKVVYGMVALLLVAVVGAILKLAIK